MVNGQVSERGQTVNGQRSTVNSQRLAVNVLQKIVMQQKSSDPLHTVSSVKSTCCYCGVGCGVIIQKDRQGRLTVEGDKDHPVNKGMLCSKGLNLHYTVMDQGDRLLFPEMRYNRNQPRQRVSWDKALERTAAVFASLIQRYGPDA